MTPPRTIIRPDRSGRVDDVVIEGATFRLERMAENHWWASAIRGDKSVSFSITSRTRIDVDAYDDEIGCVDDVAGARDDSEALWATVQVVD